ncbi:MAG TPA: DNA cytosine methyltransferase [Flavobacteriia bacterium]|nr:DNA cytosine methyltransferase [Flavobacteriia bacterium]
MKIKSLFDFINDLDNKGKDIKALTYISLFSSAGIGCYGFKQQKFHCIATNEYLEKRLKIQQYNNKCTFSTGYIQGDISKKEIQDKIYKEMDNNNVKDLDVLIATPPCQGMSVANHKKKDETKRNSLVVESIKIVDKIKPKIFIFENVRAFLNTMCTDIDGIDKSISKVIELRLNGEYNILSKIVNFKDYGSNSSRTRTLVIGVRKDLVNISPYQLFPKQKKAKTLKELIGDFHSLSIMGEIDKNDIYHSFRNYDKKMLPWIENIKEGESAFDNVEEHRIPHRVVEGKIVFNQNKNGDKYSRWYWDRVAPCIHTRNDILSSQSTIHPTDNRVFSIRELMRMMTIPDDFRWSDMDFKTLNSLSDVEKKKFLKEEELKIRHCIGEAVPSKIFEQIALNIKQVLNSKSFSINEINRLIEENNLSDKALLKEFLLKNPMKLNTNALYNIAELSNLKRTETKAYFTREDIVFNVVNKLPEFKGKRVIKILEPSVGIGNFLPQLFKRYEHIENVLLDVIDIDSNSLEILQILLKKIKVPKNFIINFINDDFLLWTNKYQYDLVVGNPPFGKVVKNRDLLDKYKLNSYNKKTNNLFSFFIEKSSKIAKNVSLIVPKSLINSPEFNQTRELLETYNLSRVTDYGEKAFKGVKIETISFLLDTISKKIDTQIVVESYITNSVVYQDKAYIFSKEFPYWLIYRNSFFDMVVDKMELDIYESFRDRQITKKHTLSSGKIRVLKSRNIASNAIKDIENYDCFIDEVDSFVVSKYLNQSDIILVPNLTYNPRATFLPKDSIADGSVALLKVKNNIEVTSNHLEYYNTKEFIEYYKIARNRGTRSLNIDNNSVQFFGLLKEG